MNDDTRTDDTDDRDSHRSVVPLFPRPAVPAPLEGRVAESLAQAGLINGPAKRSKSWRAPTFWRIAASAAFFLAGFGSARLISASNVQSVVTSIVPDRRYALLFYGNSNYASVDDVAANRSWAEKLAADGRLVSGEKLKAGGLEVLRGDESVEPPLETITELQGFFVISARSDAEAVSIARSSPHFRNGGRIVVSPIEPT